jgi:hypothetical protein
MGVFLLLHSRLRARLAVDDETSTVPVGIPGPAAGSGGVAHPVGVTQHLASGVPHPSGGAPAGRPISDASGGQLGGDRPGSVERR